MKIVLKREHSGTYFKLLCNYVIEIYISTVFLNETLYLYTLKNNNFF